MKFFPPAGRSNLHLALTSGHTLLIEEGGTEVPPLFHRAAIAAFCRIKNEPANATVKAAQPAFDREQVILNAINDMLDGNAEGDFTADGKPDLRALIKRVGFPLTRDERDKAWAKSSADNFLPGD